MSKKTLWKDIKKCFLKSKGRFISITCLIALGSFALVGLQVAGPNMRMTGENYFNRLNLADISIIGDYGIDEENQKAKKKSSPPFPKRKNDWKGLKTRLQMWVRF